jgi:hypothetical protein
VNNNLEEKYANLEAQAQREPRTAEAAPVSAEEKPGEPGEATALNDSNKAAAPAKPVKKIGQRGKRKADVVRPGPLYQIVDAIITIAGLALVGAVILYIIMIFG